MPIVNRVADLQPDIQAWRRDIHEHPELLYDVHRTAALVADRLREFGCDEVITGVGRTGVVGVIKGDKPAGRGDVKVIGLRADMDALPIEEATNLPYASTTKGLMHACGHDGHTAMLLGAAKYLAETRNFAGTIHFIFQPAEENEGGAKPDHVDLALAGLLALDHADDAGAAEAGGDLVAAEFAQAIRDECRSAMDVVEQFGVFMDIAAPGLNIGLQIGDAVDDGHGTSLASKVGTLRSL